MLSAGRFCQLVTLTELSLSSLVMYRLPNALIAKCWDGQDGLCLPALLRMTVEDVMFGLPETFKRGLPGQLVQALNEWAHEA